MSSKKSFPEENKESEGEELSGGFKLNYLAFIALGLASLIIVYRVLFSPQYIFSIDAITDVLRLKLDPEAGSTKWRTKGAIFCSRTELDMPSFPDPGNACGGGRWKAYYSRDSEQALEIKGRANAVFRIIKDSGLHLSLQGESGEANVGALAYSNGSKKAMIGAKVNLVWPLPANHTGKHLFSHGVFPFAAAAAIGQDISWSTNSMMKAGNIDVFTSDEVSASSRKKIADSKLMLGDQVSLGSIKDKNRLITPKGFVYYQDGKNDFKVVVHGYATDIRVERYGDNGYIYKPEWISRLINDPVLKVWVPILLSIFGLVTTISNMSERKKLRKMFWLFFGKFKMKRTK